MIKGKMVNCKTKYDGNVTDLYTLTLGVYPAEDGLGVQVASSATARMVSLANGYTKDAEGKELPEQLLKDIQELESKFVKNIMDLLVTSAECEATNTRQSEAKVLEGLIEDIMQNVSIETLQAALEAMKNGK